MGFSRNDPLHRILSQISIDTKQSKQEEESISLTVHSTEVVSVVENPSTSSENDSELFSDEWVVLRLDLLCNVDMAAQYDAFIAFDAYRDAATNAKDNAPRLRSLLPSIGHHKIISNVFNCRSFLCV